MMLVQKKQYPQRACRLGDGSALEQELLQRGLLHPAPGGVWTLTTREAREQGELVRPGDYVKLDSLSMPYPNDPLYFRQNHTHLEGEWYLQNTRPVDAWSLDQPADARIRFLMERGLLTVDLSDPGRTFSAFLWGTEQTAARDAVIILTGAVYGEDGVVTGVTFHMVAGDEFQKTYDILECGI